MAISVRSLIAVAGVGAMLAMSGIHGWGGQPPAGNAGPQAVAPAPAAGTEQGIPIDSALVQKACAPCHKTDAQQRLSRISYRRTTPEGWQQTIKRMVALNGLQIDPATAREVVKYLSNHLGLAPAELRPAAFEVERRPIEYKYEADPDTEKTCTPCHSFGRVLTERRAREEWELLIAMHRGFYPLVDFQAFRRTGRPGGNGEDERQPPDRRHPMDRAIDHLSKAFPLQSAEWTAWSKNLRPPELAGRWAVQGYAPGRGSFHGLVSISGARASDEFTTKSELVYAATGERETRSGSAIVYTGYQWRGRSARSAAGTNGDVEGSLREVMLVDPDWRRMTGRWFTGAYDEMGVDVTLRRLGTGPAILGLSRPALQAPSSGTLRIDGVNLPARLSPADFDFGRGVTVRRIVRSDATRIEIEVDVAAGTPSGRREVAVAGLPAPQPLALYDRVDRITVVPRAGMARVGGLVAPKQLQQFDAIAYHHGPDGKPDTADDIELGRVEVEWSLEEYSAVYQDDDLAYVGTLDRNGLFTPNVDGPNPARKNNANNIGDVWVVATYTPPGDSGARPLRARAHLLVTVPLYLRFGQPEVLPP